jgi:hypothetical protein
MGLPGSRGDFLEHSLKKTVKFIDGVAAVGERLRELSKLILRTRLCDRIRGLLY